MRPGTATCLRAPSVAPAVAATRREVVIAGTSRVLGLAPRLRTRVVMVVPTGTKMVRLVMRARPIPVVVWTETRCPRSVSILLGSSSVLRVGRGRSRPLSEG